MGGRGVLGARTLQLTSELKTRGIPKLGGQPSLFPHSSQYRLACSCENVYTEAYRLIRARTNVKTRELAITSIARVLEIVKEVNGVEPLEVQLWTSIQHKDISRPIRGFL